MNTFEPQVTPQGHYDTKTTCKVLEIGRSTLARYRNAGLITPRYHKANMRPYYLGADIKKFWLMLV